MAITVVAIKNLTLYLVFFLEFLQFNKNLFYSIFVPNFFSIY